jgi:TRAP-type transport system small permease protein
MDRLLSLWWRLLVVLLRIERIVGTTLIATIVVAITLQVITRYVWGRPIVWVEEVATYAFLWSVFLGASIGLKELRHIRIETFVSRLPDRARAKGLVLIYTLIGAVCLLIGTYAIDIMSIESRSQTMSLPINVGRHWFYSVPLAVGLFAMAFTAAYFIFAYAALALTGRPVDAEVAAAERRARDFEEGEAEARRVESVL